jgi:hypothetical protein
MLELDTWLNWAERAKEQLNNHLESKTNGAATSAQKRFIENQELSCIGHLGQNTHFTPASLVFLNPLVTTQVKAECNKEFAD